MQHTPQRNFARPDNNRLPDLMKLFGCADVIAPVDEDTFGRRAGELICRKKAAIAGKYRLRALQCEEVAAQTRDSYAKDMLTAVAREFVETARQVEDGEL